MDARKIKSANTSAEAAMDSCIASAPARWKLSLNLN